VSGDLGDLDLVFEERMSLVEDLTTFSCSFAFVSRDLGDLDLMLGERSLDGDLGGDELEPLVEVDLRLRLPTEGICFTGGDDTFILAGEEGDLKPGPLVKSPDSNLTSGS